MKYQISKTVRKFLKYSWQQKVLEMQISFNDNIDIQDTHCYEVREKLGGDTLNKISL